MKEEVIHYEKKEHIAFITLNRPEKRNALDSDAVKVLRKTWVDFESDPELRVAILAANGKVFCSGIDLGDLEVASIISSCIPNVGVEVTKPIIGAINGPAIGVGISLATGCDIKVMSEKASFIFPEAKIGLAHGGIDLLKFVPYAVAMELWLTGDPLSAKRAYEVGMVNKVVAEAEVMNEALKYANAIKGNAPLTLKMLKMLAVEHTVTVRSAWYRVESQYIRPQLESEDMKEGVRAFKEKRKPAFKGK